MMKMMIEKAKLEEPSQVTGGSSSSKGNSIKAERWGAQRFGEEEQ